MRFVDEIHTERGQVVVTFDGGGEFRTSDPDVARDFDALADRVRSVLGEELDVAAGLLFPPEGFDLDEDDRIREEEGENDRTFSIPLR